MPRKRIAEPEPAVSTEGAAAAPAKAPVKRSKPAPEVKARAPRASANAVTHRHKKTDAGQNPAMAQAKAQDAEIAIPTLSESTVAPVVMNEPVPAYEPSAEEIAVKAYLLWEARGYQGGSPEDDWYTAEQLLYAERSA